MTKSFDISKFRKSITKSIDGLGIGFNDPTDWISTGNYALNYLISGSFDKGVPMGKVTVFAGESGAGKSYICSGNIIRHAQEQGIFVILIDSENALDEAWLHALGVDTSDEKLLKLNMAMIDDVAKTISEFMKDYRAMAEVDRPKILFVVDSLGMLLTPTDVNEVDGTYTESYRPVQPTQPVQQPRRHHTGGNPKPRVRVMSVGSLRPELPPEKPSVS